MRDIKAVDKEYKQKMDDLDYKVGMFAIGPVSYTHLKIFMPI